MDIKEKLLNLIFPPVCGFCDEITNQFLCDKCRRKFEQIKVSKIDDYEKDPVYFDEHFYLFKYEREIRNDLLKYKFKEKSYLFKSYAKLIAEDSVFNKQFIEKYDFIISVPIHKKRFKTRGYNQSELIAKELSKLVGKCFLDEVLVKSKNIVAQSSLDDKLQRIKNIKDAFDSGENIGLVNGKKVAIFDDIFTTGATINECAKVLKNKGAEFVGVITLART